MHLIVTYVIYSKQWKTFTWNLKFCHNCHVSTQDAVIVVHAVCFSRWHRWTALGHGSCHIAAWLAGVMALVRCAVSDGSSIALQIPPLGSLWQLCTMPLQPGIHAPVTAVTGTGFFVLPLGAWHDKRIASFRQGLCGQPFSFPLHFRHLIATYCLCWVVKWQ